MRFRIGYYIYFTCQSVYKRKTMLKGGKVLSMGTKGYGTNHLVDMNSMMSFISGRIFMYFTVENVYPAHQFSFCIPYRAFPQ